MKTSLLVVKKFDKKSKKIQIISLIIINIILIIVNIYLWYLLIKMVYSNDYHWIIFSVAFIFIGLCSGILGYAILRYNIEFIITFENGTVISIKEKNGEIFSRLNYLLDEKIFETESKYVLKENFFLTRFKETFPNSIYPEDFVFLQKFSRSQYFFQMDKNERSIVHLSLASNGYRITLSNSARKYQKRCGEFLINTLNDYKNFLIKREQIYG